MKKYLLLILFTILIANCKAQQNCSCIEGLEYNKTAICTKGSILKKNRNKYLKFYCTRVLRIYYNDKQGTEVEKFQLECISTKDTLIKLSPNYIYHGYSEKEFIIAKSQKKFFAELKEHPKNFYEIQLDENKEIKLISNFELPAEEIKKNIYATKNNRNSNAEL